MNQEKGKINSKIIIIVAIVLVALAAVVLIIFLNNRTKSYRVIKIYEVTGETKVVRADKGELDAYENMLLQSGDVVYVESGRANLKLDDDKFIYVEEASEFEIIATGNKANSRTTINLHKGEITNEITNKLSDGSVYEVNTENSNMSVRGTIYYVGVSTDENGNIITRTVVFDGTVETSLIDENGNIVGESVLVGQNQEVSVIKDDTHVDFLSDVEEAQLNNIPVGVLNMLIEKVSDGDTRIDIKKEDLEDALEEIEEKKVNEDEEDSEEEGPFTVSFVYNGEEFGSQVVEKGALILPPSLMPAASGRWDYDFSEPVMEDLTINWN